MNKKFKMYIACWMILVALFNVAVFVTPLEQGGAFWPGYIFIMVAFLAQLITAWYTFLEKNIQKLFYKISLIRISWTGLVLTILFGTACIVVPVIPYWVGIVLCFAVVGFNVISIIKANIAADIVSNLDEKIKVSTFFIKSLTADVEGLVSRAQSAKVKEECKKIYEKVRYSDPMSNVEFRKIEIKITDKYSELAKAVEEDNYKTVENTAKEMISLVEDRNRKCKLLK